MKASELEYVKDTIECEGFDYAFVDYSDFSEVKDEEFHKLREAYMKAAEELREYVGFN